LWRFVPDQYRGQTGEGAECGKRYQKEKDDDGDEMRYFNSRYLASLANAIGKTDSGNDK
jgi:hypothetical protein